ncbi:MAG: hypothetical protein HYX34_07605 [Actinobacteria bacterium]|nr:hypothetical protein [Actinomycetota bacterium]
MTVLVPRSLLAFERAAVDALTDDLDRGDRARVMAYVDGALAAMPEHIRAGVAVESLALGAWTRVTALAHWGRTASVDAEFLDRLDRSPVGPLRQHARLLRSLTLFARHEIAGDEAGA